MTRHVVLVPLHIVPLHIALALTATRTQLELSGDTSQLENEHYDMREAPARHQSVEGQTLGGSPPDMSEAESHGSRQQDDLAKQGGVESGMTVQGKEHDEAAEIRQQSAGWADDVDGFVHDASTTYCRLKSTFGTYKASHTETWKDCAIVSSSGDILNHRFGGDIDKHEIVFRVNGAPSGGKYSDLVGSKESVRVIAGRPFSFYRDEKKMASRLRDKPVLILPLLARERFWTWFVTQQFRDTKLRFDFLPPDGWTQIRALGGFISRETVPEERVEASDATTGSVAVLAALNHCDALTLYSYQPGNATDAYHFYGQDGAAPGGIDAEHNKVHKALHAEHKLWMHLSNEGKKSESTGIMHMKGFAAVACPGSKAAGGPATAMAPETAFTPSPEWEAAWEALEIADLWYTPE